MTDALRRDRPRRRERPRRRSGASTARASASRSCTASPTGRCGCPTGCAGTCSRCSPRRSTGCGARPTRRAARRRRRRLGRRLRAARRRATACSGCRSTTATRAPTGWSRARTRASAATSSTRVTGIQTMPINTVFQLLADEGSAGAGGRRADRARPRPLRPVAHRRARQRGDDRLDDRPARRAHRRLGARADRAPRPAGRAVRRRHDRARHDDRPGPRRTTSASRAGAPVHAVAGHDTASAFAAAPLRDASAPRSCRRARGRCSGSSSPSRCSAEQARAYNLTNERGVDGHDPAAAQRHGPVARAGVPARVGGRGGRRLRRAAPARGRARAPGRRAVRPRRRRRSWRRATCPRGSSRRAARAARSRRRTRGEVVRSVLASLACKYRLVLERLERVTGREVDVVHVIGGGARQRAAVPADRRRARPPGARRARSRRPRSATCSCRRAPPASSARCADMRAVAAASADPTTYEPAAPRRRRRHLRALPRRDRPRSAPRA